MIEEMTMIEEITHEWAGLDAMEWAIVAAIGLCGFVWLVLPFIVCPHMFDGHLSGPPWVPEPKNPTGSKLSKETEDV